MLRIITWVDRRGTAITLVALLLLVCAAAHRLALAKIQLIKTLAGPWEARVVRNVAGIEFINSNWWFILPYLALFFGAVLYLEWRSAPRWALRLSFFFLALPTLGYLWTCLRVSLVPG